MLCAPYNNNSENTTSSLMLSMLSLHRYCAFWFISFEDTVFTFIINQLVGRMLAYLYSISMLVQVQLPKAHMGNVSLLLSGFYPEIVKTKSNGKSWTDICVVSSFLSHHYKRYNLTHCALKKTEKKSNWSDSWLGWRGAVVSTLQKEG